MFEIINQDDAKKLILSEVNIFDVRDQISFHEKHINNAKLLSGENFDEVCKACNKATPTIVYCYKGIRSQTIAKILAEQGFEKVYSLKGGFSSWEV